MGVMHFESGSSVVVELWASPFFAILVDYELDGVLHTGPQLNHSSDGSWTPFDGYIHHHFCVFFVTLHTPNLLILRREGQERRAKRRRRQHVRTRLGTEEHSIGLQIPIIVSVDEEADGPKNRLGGAPVQNCNGLRRFLQSPMNQSSPMRRRGWVRGSGSPSDGRNSSPETSFRHIYMFKHLKERGIRRNRKCFACFQKTS